LRFRPGDAADLADKLTRFLSDPALAAALDFGDEPVKDMRLSAAEMEAHYRRSLEARKEA
jgi:hypothetical protein